MRAWGIGEGWLEGCRCQGERSSAARRSFGWLG